MNWESFIWIDKITFTIAQRAALFFKDTKVIRPDISFSKLNQFVTLKLKASKINVNQTWILIVIGAKD